MGASPGRRFWTHLRDRKLVQWCLAYVAAAWLVMQAVDVVAGRWNVPLGLQRGVDLVLGVGFFVALTLAWYHGEKGRQRVSGPELLILAMLFVLVGMGLSLLEGIRPPATVASGAVEDEDVAGALGRLPGLAVLPLANRSEVAADQYFTDGIYDDLLTQLQRIAGLRVISRTSAEVYRGTDETVPDIGRELGVDYVLEGGVQRAGSNVRINLQLIDARNDGHLWAETYDRVLTPEEILQVQSDVVRTVATELGGVLRSEDLDRAARSSTGDPEAYDLYARARDAEGRGDLERAETFLRQATERDPDFLAGQVTLTMVSGNLYQYQGQRAVERAALARAAAERAVELDPESPDAQLAMGIYLYRVPRDYERALEWLGRAAGTLRGDYTYHRYRAYAERRMGQWRQSVSSSEAAVALSPRAAGPRQELAVTLLNMRRYEDAQAVLSELLELYPDLVSAYAYRGLVEWLSTGDTDRLQEMIERFAPLPSTLWLTRWELSLAREDGPGTVAAAEESGEAVANPHVWYPRSLLVAFSRELLGDAEGAAAAYREAAAVLEPRIAESPEDERYHAALGLTYAGLGLHDDALREARRATEILPLEKDALTGPSQLFALAAVHARFGEVQEAVEILERLLTVPSRYSAPMLREHYLLRPLWDEPAFLALLEREPGRVF